MSRLSFNATRAHAHYNAGFMITKTVNERLHQNLIWDGACIRHKNCTQTWECYFCEIMAPNVCNGEEAVVTAHQIVSRKFLHKMPRTFPL